MRELLKKAARESRQAELYKREIEKIALNMISGKIQQVDGRKTEEIALRLIKDGRMGNAAATSLRDETVVDRAILSGRYQNNEPVAFPCEKPSEVKCHDKRVAELSLEELAAELARIDEMLRKADKDINACIVAERKIEKNHIVNTAGFDGSYSKTFYKTGLYTKTSKGFMEIFSYYNSAGYCEFSEKDIYDLAEIYGRTREVAGVRTGKMPAIFSGKAFGALIMRLLFAVNGENIVKGVSPLRGKIGERIFSDRITVRDNGTLDYGLGTCPFDDEGVPVKDTVLVEKGVLKNYLLGLPEGTRLNMEPTGNSFRRALGSDGIENAPTVGPSNILIEGHGLPDEELIGNIDSGIYIDNVMGMHTGNIPAGEYSFNIGFGYLIKNGKCAGKVMNTMVTGNIYEDFNKIVALGTKKEAMNMIFTDIGYSPAVLFNDLSIAGGKV